MQLLIGKIILLKTKVGPWWWWGGGSRNTGVFIFSFGKNIVGGKIEEKRRKNEWGNWGGEKAKFKRIN